MAKPWKGSYPRGLDHLLALERALEIRANHTSQPQKQQRALPQRATYLHKPCRIGLGTPAEKQDMQRSRAHARHAEEGKRAGKAGAEHTTAARTNITHYIGRERLLPSPKLSGHKLRPGSLDESHIKGLRVVVLWRGGEAPPPQTGARTALGAHHVRHGTRAALRHSKRSVLRPGAAGFAPD